MIHVQSDDRRRAATIPARMGVPIQYVITKPGAESQTLGFCRSRYDWCDDRLHGRSDFELYHTRLLSGPFKQSSLKVLDTAVSFLGPDLAVLHWTWSIKGDGLEDPTTHEPRKGIFTMIVERQGTDWVVVVAQNTNQMTG